MARRFGNAAGYLIDVRLNGPISVQVSLNPLQVILNKTNGDFKARHFCSDLQASCGCIVLHAFCCLECGHDIETSVSKHGVVTVTYGRVSVWVWVAMK